jgi:hypothetical protein
MRYLDSTKLNLGARCVLLHSEMGTAKTSNVLLKLVEQSERILIVTPKRLFARSIQGVLTKAGHRFTHYCDEGFYQRDDAKVIVELESLGRLYWCGAMPYDLVILDESETII